MYAGGGYQGGDTIGGGCRPPAGTMYTIYNIIIIILLLLYYINMYILDPFPAKT